jgi:NADH-quinone oxidoreductase subunit J
MNALYAAIPFYGSAAVAVAATVMVITRRDVVHAVLYLVVSLLAVASLLFLGGAPFAAALEVILYAGAIMVLFVFVVMLLNLGQSGVERERGWLRPSAWTGPSLLAVVLLVQLGVGVLSSDGEPRRPGGVGPREVGVALFGPYVVGVELASLLLLAGLVAGYHLGRPLDRQESAS